MLKRCVGFMMAKMVLRELMDPLNFLKFKSFLMKVQHATPPPPPFTCITSLDKIKFLFINFYQFLEDWNAFAVTLFAQYEKNPIVSSCTTHHMLVLILRSCTGILSVNCVTKFLFYGWVQGNDPSCLREFLLQILSRNSPSGNVGLQVSSTNANYHTLSYTFHNIYKDCFL